MYANTSQRPALDDILERDHSADRERIERLLNVHRDIGFAPGTCPILELPASGRDWGDPNRIPEVAFAELDSAIVKDAMVDCGYLIVRNMLDPATCEQLRDVIDALQDESAAQARSKDTFSGEQGVFNDPPRNIDELMEKTSFGVPRSYHRATGSAMCLESPSTARYLMELYEEMGLKQIMAEYFGEPSALSALKWVMRRTLNEDIGPDGWHQDGSFMGADIHSLNLWVSLSHCGADSGAPGLDLIPGRSRDIYQSTTGKFPWMMTDEDIARDFADSMPQSPEFQVGDAIFFDHFSIHRTQYRQDFRRRRYAIESWFFARSKCPSNQVPLAW